MTAGRLHYEKVGAAGHIVFDNPAAYNALTWGMWGQLAETCRAIATDSEVKVVTLRGAGGKAFVSGTDIEGFRSFASGRDGIEYERLMDSYVGELESLPQPTIAVIEGYAVGGGLALACACDFRVATVASKFGSPLARTIGNCLSAKGYARMVAHAGISQAKRMLLLGELLTAEELLDFGFLLKAVDPERLDATVAELCERLASNAPLTIAASKAAIGRLVYGNLPDIDDLIEMIYASADFNMGIQRFLNKSKPEWTGR